MEKQFVELVNSNRALIFKVCNLYCHDQEMRKDLFQEVVLQLWKSFPGFRKESAVSTWIYRIALNTAISNFRRESKKPDGKSITSTEFEIPDMSAIMDHRENTNMLHSAIDHLTDIEKAIIMLYLDEKTYEEISVIIGISSGNVGVRVNRIKNKLGKIVKTYQDEY
jgi:RNA polymerase sigma-70 factor (ECF subfamily)